jgi:hypothetical protein
MKFSHVVVGALCLAGCAASTSSSDPGEADPTADALTQTVPFFDNATLKHEIVEGKAFDIVARSNDLKNPLAALENSYGFDVDEYRLKPADLATLSADTKHFAQFLYEGLNPPDDESDVTDIKVTPIARGDAYTTLMSATGYKGKAATPAVQQAMRTVIKSFLSKPTRALYHVEYCPDWCDEDLVAITETGEVRVVFAFGDI